MLTKTAYDVNTAVNRFYELGLTGTVAKGGNFEKQLEAIYSRYVGKI